MSTNDAAPGERLQAAGVEIRELVAATVDYDDEPAERAYYARAHQVVELVIATPAIALEDLKVKAEAVAWCCASRDDFGLGDSRCERLMESLLKDLLA